MRNLVIYLFFFISLLGFSQNNKDYYQLSKDGEWFEKPVVYIMDSFEVVKKPSEDEVIFLTKRNKFIHQAQNHTSYTLKKEDLRNLSIYSSKDLYRIETKEYEKRASEIQKELGTKPIPPITHKILRVFIINKEELCAYEVNWL